MPAFENAPEERRSTSTSRSLLLRLHANEAGAWERLIALYAPLVWHWCRKMDLPHQEIADVFQEVFKSVAAHIQRFHKDRPQDTFRGWLQTITKNKVRDQFRRLKKEPRAAGGSEAQLRWSQLPDDASADKELDENEGYQELFHRALKLIQAEFEERSWRAFWQVVVDGRCPQDVAEELAMSPGAVRVAKCRVLRRLREELGDVSI